MATMKRKDAEEVRVQLMLLMEGYADAGKKLLKALKNPEVKQLIKLVEEARTKDLTALKGFDVGVKQAYTSKRPGK